MKVINKAMGKIIHNNKITGLSIDSRSVKPGDLFFAFNHDYIDQAIQNGAGIIICEKSDVDKKYTVPVIGIKNLRQKIGQFAQEFYDYPSENLHVIGVTGTNGKTSCVHFLAQAFEMAGYKSAVIGTLGNGPIAHLQPSIYTTPDAIAVQKLLAEFKRLKIDFVAMEASSHGLHQGRLNGTKIETGIFTNLTRDHLDYHETMENYAEAKFSLFKNFNIKQAILNLDDPYGIEWANRFILNKKFKKLIIYGITARPEIINMFKHSRVSIVFADNICITPEGLNTKLITPWGECVFTTPLWGKFNLINLLSVLIILCIHNIPVSKALFYMSNIKSAPGRMQMFKSCDKPLVIVDYAHTPDALLKTLTAIRTHCAGELWCIFGCGGDRDKGKRKEMGQIAEKYADHIILTNDNPRSENPGDIIAGIREGISVNKPFIIEQNRQRAIAHAIACAKKEDVILVAGKGAETHQEIKGQKIAYSDILTVKMLLLD